MDKPNIILIMTDQQRSDTISALDAPWMQTPHLDRLVREGTAFSNCFVTSPVCVGSRASVFTGLFPHSCQVFSNFHPWEPTWVKSLAAAGYHCVNIGKMHINPYDAPGGFHQRFPVENKDRPLFLEEHDRALYDEWDKALHARGLAKPSRYTRFKADPEGYKRALGAFVWDLPEDMHPDNFTGNTARWWIEERKATSPMFLQIGFPGPHPPYDPVQSYLDQYQNVQIPLPSVSKDELERQPRAQTQLRNNMMNFNFDSVSWRADVSQVDLLRLRRHYAANVSMIDTQVGAIMHALGKKGYLDNAVVIFTSDHADALGDHGHIQKWTMYDSVLKVPLVVCSPGRVNQGAVCNDLVQLMDIAPTVLQYAGIAIPAQFEARSLCAPLAGEKTYEARTAVYSELARDHIQTGSEFIAMRRDRKWKIVHYLDDEYGELYYLPDDPGEAINLWDAPQHRQKRDELLLALLQWIVRGTLHGNQHFQKTPQQPMRI